MMDNLNIWHDYSDAIRHELESYGELLNLIDDQRAAILAHDYHRIQESNDRIENQLTEVRRVNRLRVAMQLDSLGIASPSTVRELARAAPEVIQPMLEAMLAEAERLVSETRQQTRLNHMLLKTALDTARRICASVLPKEMKPTVYGQRGTTHPDSLTSGSHYHSFS